MTLSIHTSQDASEWTDRGFVRVGQHRDRVEYADADRTCLHRMRPWKGPDAEQDGYCLLDRGHRGRHATVVFFCDGCQKARRGEPHRSNNEVSMCFMCCEVDNPWR